MSSRKSLRVNPLPAANTVRKCSKKREELISDNLWAALFLIQDELTNSVVKTQKTKTEDSIQKPSFWDDFVVEKKIIPDRPIQKDLKKWLIRLKTRATVLALNLFLETIADDKELQARNLIL